MKTILSAALAVTVCLASASAGFAEDKVEDPGIRPVVLLVPKAELVEGDEEVSVVLAIPGSWSGRVLSLHVRRAGDPVFEENPFRRDVAGTYSAAIPAGFIRPPGVEYYVSSTGVDGVLEPVSGTGESPHFSLVEESDASVVERIRLKRHHGRRVRFEATATYRNLGLAPRYYEDEKGEFTELMMHDWYNSSELSFTVRPLMPSIYQMTFGYGMVGGVMGAMTPDRYEFFSDAVPEASKPLEAPYLPGVYYGFARAYWEFGDLFGIEPRVMMGASHRGFEVGGGALARLGTIEGVHMDVEFEGITNVGWRFLVEFQMPYQDILKVGLRNEITTYPAAGPVATLPSLRLSAMFGGVEVTGGIGYGAREKCESGGIAAEVGAAVEF